LNDTGHIVNKYDRPRNKPLFVNISHEVTDTVDEKFEMIKRSATDNLFEEQIETGNYYAPLWEDSICDGKVSAEIQLFRTSAIGANIKVESKVQPAFSIVTAPDFFPQVDSFDLLEFDTDPGNSSESNFYEGGVSSLAAARIEPNPAFIKNADRSLLKTYTAVLSAIVPTPWLENKPPINYSDPTLEKGYFVSGYLPDVCSSIFAPGWDITYAGGADNIYLSTKGLGSPFVEDMKLCAAMNGMWPAASPDSSRTYQGGLESGDRNPTAIPLLDEEIGFHPASPRGGGVATTGWDGEQGPFLEFFGDTWYVNFTDLGRADSVQNTIDGKLDMSKLRDLTSKELLSRMNCLHRCIKALPPKNFSNNKPNMVGLTFHWLVSAEKVNWGIDDANAYGIPSLLVGTDREWIAAKKNSRVRGPGYLYVFVDTEVDKTEKSWYNEKRRRLLCKMIYVCQVTDYEVAWACVEKGVARWGA
jgi:hypothetical protein